MSDLFTLRWLQDGKKVLKHVDVKAETSERNTFFFFSCLLLTQS